MRIQVLILESKGLTRSMRRKGEICFNIFIQSISKKLACPNRLSVRTAIDVMAVCMKMESSSL